MGQGSVVYFDFEKVTADMLEYHFRKSYRIEKGENSLFLFKYAGNIDVGNKIGDVKAIVAQ